MKITNTYLYLVLCISAFVIAEFSKFILNYNGLIYSDLIEVLSYEKADKLFETIRKWQLAAYVFIPILLFVKTHIIASIIGIGAFLTEWKIAYKDIWRICLIAEFLFVAASLIKTLWIFFLIPNFSLIDVQMFYPFSLLSLFRYEEIAPWYIPMLQVVNIFQIVYCLSIAYLLNKVVVSKKGNPGLKIVVTSYGPALLLWVVAVMFITLNIS